MAQDVIYPGEGSVCTWGKGEIHCFGVKCPIAIRSNWSIVSFKVCVSLLIFCLFDLSIGVSGGIKVSQYYCVIVNFPFHTCYHLPYILWCTYISIIVGCIYIYNCYIFFLDWSFDHYVVAFFVAFHSLCFKVYFIEYEYCHSCFLLVSYLRDISFSSPSLSVCMCPLFWSGSLVGSIYRGLVFVSIQPVFAFWLGRSTHLRLR